jgi:hypothetical protein
MLSTLLAISQIESSYAQFCIGLPLCFALDASLLSLISGLLDASALFENVEILISSSLALMMASFMDIHLMARLRVFNLETNTVAESCDVTFDETAPYPHNVLKCAGDKGMEESIFVDEGLQGVDSVTH